TNAAPVHAGPFPITTVADVTGGGDAALAGTIFGLLEGRPLAEAARWGQAAAALTVSVPETVNPTLSPRALQAMLRQRPQRAKMKERAA
ncbi:MAG TPA: PfkB family carbohydrate kinase, partial [Dongiaceae bacterium]